MSSAPQTRRLKRHPGGAPNHVVTSRVTPRDQTHGACTTAGGRDVTSGGTLHGRRGTIKLLISSMDGRSRCLYMCQCPCGRGSLGDKRSYQQGICYTALRPDTCLPWSDGPSLGALEGGVPQCRMLNLRNDNTPCHLNGHVPCQLLSCPMLNLRNTSCHVIFIAHLSKVTERCRRSILRNSPIAASKLGVEGHLGGHYWFYILTTRHNNCYTPQPCNA